jgi:hypothetical protein
VLASTKPSISTLCVTRPIARWPQLRAPASVKLQKTESKGSGEAGADAVAEGFAVDDLAFEGGFGGFDDGSHLFHGVGAGFGEGFGDGGVHFGFAGAGGQIGLEDGEFFGFFVDEVLSVAFAELVDGLLALFDERLQDLDGFGFVESVDFLGFFVLDGGFYAAEDAQAEFVFGAHGVG